jgi:Tfp pilus assembly protein PilF
MEIWDQAVEFHTQKRFAEAEALYDQLLTQNHTNPGLLATLGTMYLETGKTGLAITLLESSLKNGGARQADVLSNLGVAYRNAGLTDKAKACLDESIKGAPSPAALANYAGMYIESEHQSKAIAACEKAIREDPNLPIAHWNLAIMQLANGQWETGWDEHEWGLKTRGMRVNRELGGWPEWDGTPGKKVVIYGEQGIGDELMFASMLPDVMKTNEVVIECHERLVTLFQKSFPGVTVYGTREEIDPQWVTNETADARLAIGSLGKFYRRARNAFPGTPYMKAEPAIPRGDKLRVGISWTGGGAKASRVQKRSIPLAWWKPILNTQNVEFVSLQYTECAEEIEVMNALGYDIKVMDEYVKAHDYHETARLVKSCDLVISVATSVYHLAGALGVPAWVMVPRNPPWREQMSGGIPWYRSVRVYRQPTEGTTDAWTPVIQRVGADLEDLVDMRLKERAA